MEILYSDSYDTINKSMKSKNDGENVWPMKLIVSLDNEWAEDLKGMLNGL